MQELKKDDIISLTSYELKLILEHTGVILANNELTKEKIRLEKKIFKNKFFRFPVVYAISFITLFVFVLSFILSLFITQIENEDLLKHLSLLFLVSLIIIYTLILIYNIVFYFIYFRYIKNLLQHFVTSLGIALILGYQCTSVQNEIYLRLISIIEKYYIIGSIQMTLIVIGNLILGLFSAVFLFLVLKTVLILEHRKWSFLKLEEVIIELFLFSAFLGFYPFLSQDHLTYFLNIFVIAFFNFSIIIKFDEKKFIVYREYFQDIFKYMSKY